MSLIDAARKALEALEEMYAADTFTYGAYIRLVEPLRAAIKEAEKAEPVALAHNWNEHLNEYDATEYEHDFRLFKVVEAYVLKHLTHPAAPAVPAMSDHKEQDAAAIRKLLRLSPDEVYDHLRRVIDSYEASKLSAAPEV